MSRRLLILLGASTPTPEPSLTSLCPPGTIDWLSLCSDSGLYPGTTTFPGSTTYPGETGGLGSLTLSSLCDLSSAALYPGTTTFPGSTTYPSAGPLVLTSLC